VPDTMTLDEYIKTREAQRARGLEPNAAALIRQREQKQRRIADILQRAGEEPSDDEEDDSSSSSSTTDPDAPFDGDLTEEEDESRSGSSSGSSSSSSSSGVPDPEERARLMSHGKLQALARDVRAGRYEDHELRRLTERVERAEMEHFGTVREFVAGYGENLSQLSGEQFMARSVLGLGSTQEIYTARDVARAKVQAGPEYRLSKRMRDEAVPDAEKVREAFGVGGSAPLAKVRAAALAKVFGGVR